MLHLLKPIKGARKTKKRLGRGPGSGNGKTAGKGHKGQLARSGGKTRIGFEGGQTPFFQRIPKRGFYSFQKTKYSLVNLNELEIFDNDILVNRKLLIQKKIVPKNVSLIKVLAKGELTKKLTVQASKFSNKAQEIIRQKGGNVEIVR
ncbi:50S ribosomal protein L15 [Candidatus Phytoplasma phoenicium]|uniref:Large ribosomal subunit protein uL15 n=1 Tax=Candidatus Phytoplasma phoenicium TaxID=198422 RepID=A0A0L0MK59_9MOLU|nr:50S ribosomal protein L15 [Candidatus Phytoplasma phoenicium]KND62773.1 50S ribosomal protein L15 [Candidatus Phytoplasma phoenicium]